MSAFVLPPLYYAMSKWPSEGGGITRAEKKALKATIRRAYFVETSLVVSIVIAGLLLKQFPANWGYDRLLAFLVGQFAFGSLSYLPFFFIRTSAVKAR